MSNFLKISVLTTYNNLIRSETVADIKKQLGQRIKYLRKHKGLSQEQLAEIIGLSTRSLGNIETGRFFMSMSNMEKLIDALDIEPYELFIFDKNAPEDIVFDDVVKKLEKYKNNTRRLYAISAFLDYLR